MDTELVKLIVFEIVDLNLFKCFDLKVIIEINLLKSNLSKIEFEMLK